MGMKISLSYTNTITGNSLNQPTKRCITSAIEVDKAAAPNIILTIHLTRRVSICAMSARTSPMSAFVA